MLTDLVILGRERQITRALRLGLCLVFLHQACSKAQSLDGTYSVTETWSVSYHGITRTGTASGTISVVNNGYRLVDKTGFAQLGETNNFRSMLYNGSTYSIDGGLISPEGFWYGATWYFVVRISFFVLAVPFGSEAGVGFGSLNPPFHTTGTSLSSLAGYGREDPGDGNYIVASTKSVLTIHPVAPSISAQPLDQIVTIGSPVNLSVQATGTAPLNYQWKHFGTNVFNGRLYSGVNSTRLSITNAQNTQAGRYTVTVSNSKGSITSSNAQLTVRTRATATLTLGDLTQTYDGTAKTVSVTTTPPGLLVDLTYNGLSNAPINAGTYTVIASVNDPNYQGATTNTLLIGKATGSLTLGNLLQIYDGTAKTVAATTTPYGLAVNLTYNGLLNAPTNIGTYVVIALINDQNYLGGATNELTVLPDFATSLNTTNIKWSTSGDVQWFIQTNVTYGGKSALQSGAISSTQRSILQAVLSGPGSLKFWWKVSSPDYGSSFQVLMNGVTLFNWGGAWDWNPQTIYIGQGAQTLQWIFTYSGSSSEPHAAWIDQVSFIPGATAPILTTQPKSQSQAIGMDVVFSVEASGTPPLTYQWQFNGAAIPGAIRSSLTVTDLVSSKTGDYSVVVTNLGGSVVTSNAVLGLGPVGAWGDNDYGQTSVPLGLSNAVGIAAGGWHALALSGDGTVIAWGLHNLNQVEIPAGLTNVIAISAGQDHSLALKHDGTVIAWGDGSFGQTSVPINLGRIVSIAGGGLHSLALRDDGRVVAWGAGKTKTGIYPEYGQSIIPTDLTNVVAIAAGEFHSVALTADGEVKAWGAGTTNRGAFPDHGQSIVPLGVTGVVGIAAGGAHTLALRSDGTVVGWGADFSGQINVPPNLSNAVALAAGFSSSLALRADGTAVAWGDNLYRETIVPPSLTNVVAIAAGDYHNLVLVQNVASPLGTAFSGLSRIGNSFSLSLLTQSGKVYALQYKNALSDSTWTSFPLVAGTGGLQALTDIAATAQQRFYRVVRW
jgi:alpha-tubulin suppressor-like RCC1 family protein